MLIAGVAAAGCHAALSLGDLELVDETTATGGTGGTGTGSGTSTAVGGSATGTPSGTGGGGSCVAQECPVDDDRGCQIPICNDQDQCDIEFADLGTPCAGPQDNLDWVCTAEGECVECNVEGDCTGDDICLSNACAPPYCDNNTQDQQETDEDCGGPECLPCENGQVCALPRDCESGFCDSGTGDPVCAACSGYADCPNNAWCNPTDDGGTCTPDQGLGQICTGNAQCPHPTDPLGFCFNPLGAATGICCNSVCDGICQTCEQQYGAPANGTCGNVDPSAGTDDPYNQCTGSCDTGACDPTAGGCALQSQGYSCAATVCDNDVPSSTSTSTSFGCATDGSCNPSDTTCTVGHLCNADGTCNTHCASDPNNCYANYWCGTGGNCNADFAEGEPCIGPAQCPGDHCYDNMCCDTDCSAPCESCRSSDTGVADGTCAQVTNNTAPFGDPCNGYVCWGGNCLTACDSDVQCADNRWCWGDMCVSDLPIGWKCTRPSQCISGNCVDGRCCDKSCVKECEACDEARHGVVGDDGYCHVIANGKDPDIECGSNCCIGNDAFPRCDTSGACNSIFQCGNTPQPWGTTCPAECSYCLNMSSRPECVIDCFNRSGTCRDQEVTCPDGFDCTVLCQDTTQNNEPSNACERARIECPPEAHCVVDCDDGDYSCYQAVVQCSVNGTCETNCGLTTACLGTSIICGHQWCHANCQGVVKPDMYAGTSCDPRGC
jgi:hypothetical protein